MARPTGGTQVLARVVALLLCLGCVALIVRLTLEPAAPSRPGLASVGADGDCAGRKRAEIEQEKAAGRLNAEQAMIRRQKIAAECR